MSFVTISYKCMTTLNLFTPMSNIGKMKIYLLTIAFLFTCDIFQVAIGTDSEPECGISEDPPTPSHHRIVNGTVARKGQLPWIAFIRTEYGDCTASIINRHYILTAAHCVSPLPPSVTVTVGVADYNDKTAIVDETISLNIIRHPNFSDTGVCERMAAHDIAIIKLMKPVNFDKNVRAICLKKTFKEKEKDVALISGYGAHEWFPGRRRRSVPQQNSDPFDSKLRWGTSNFVEEKKCRKESDEKFGSEKCIHDSPIVCGHGIKHVDVYKGDSGSPISVENQNRADGKRQYMQVGVTSMGDIRDYQGTPAIYTRISSYCDWISDNTEGDVTCRD